MHGRLGGSASAAFEPHEVLHKAESKLDSCRRGTSHSASIASRLLQLVSILLGLKQAMVFWCSLHRGDAQTFPQLYIHAGRLSGQGFRGCRTTLHLPKAVTKLGLLTLWK